MKLKAILLALGAAVLMSGTAYAASGINTVRIDIAPAEDLEMKAGEIFSGAEPDTWDSMYYVNSYSTSGTRNTPGTSYTYTMEIRPQAGYEFTDQTLVEVRGATKLRMESRSADSIRITAVTYPFYILKNVTGIQEDGDTVEWNKVSYASGYNVLVYYSDSDSFEKTAKLNAGRKRQISVASYSSGDRQLDHVVVRAVAGSGEGSGFIADSEYVDQDGVVDTEASGEYRFQIPTARSNSVATSTSAASVKSDAVKGVQGGPGVSGINNSSVAAGWVKSGEDWYYSTGNSYQTGWVNPTGNEWYLMDASGRMLTGWQLVNGYWYLFNTVDGSSYGKMLTGWWRVNGKWYYLNQYSTNSIPYGAMFAGGQTPDGRMVAADGSWLG